MAGKGVKHRCVFDVGAGVGESWPVFGKDLTVGSANACRERAATGAAAFRRTKRRGGQQARTSACGSAAMCFRTARCRGSAVAMASPAWLSCRWPWLTATLFSACD